LNYDPVIILLLALAIDLALGEPPEKLHLTVWIGKFIEHMEAPFRRLFRNEKAAGIAFAISTVMVSTLATIFVLWALKSFNWYLYIIVSAIAFKMTFAFRSMFKYVNPIMNNLKTDIRSSRKFLSKVVRRSTDEIDERLVASGAVETVAEGFVDGFISPMFFFAILGVPGAVAYRAINTLDSMVGYMDVKYINFGWLSAKFDTLANYVPARLSFICFVLSSMVVGLDWREAIRITKRDHGVTKSVNAAWSMAPMAGALRVQLEKKGSYIIGDEKEALSAEKISNSLKVFVLSAMIVCACVIALFLMEGLLNAIYAF
jgi:adenosylcobinamide-phosphate synthase